MAVQHAVENVSGAKIGILMLETRFPRIPGDIANATTWPFPVEYRIVPGATQHRAIREDPHEMLGDFVVAARDLVASGCAGLTTSCGFLSLIQDDLAASVPVPLVTSALMQIPLVQRMLPPGRRVGVITICAAALTPAHFDAAGAPRDTPIVGTDENGAFADAILNDRPRMDIAACRADMLEAARTLRARHPDLGAIVLECTNMAPYAAAIRAHTRLPVYSIYTLVRWFHQALAPNRFEQVGGNPAPGG